MPSLLERTAQDDFSAGMARDVAPHLIDQRGLFDVVNGLVDDDGSIYKRGGTVNKSGAAFGSSLRWLWDGYLKPGRRTVFANTADYGVLDSNDSTVVNLGGSGRTFPAPAAELRGLLFLPGGALYGGSRKASAYSTGTVTKTNGSKTLAGAGTTWTTNVDAGMLFRFGSERVYVVESVDSNTQITLEDAYEGTTAGGAAYTLSPLIDTPGAPYNAAAFYTVVGDRLVWAVENQVRFGTPDNPHAVWVASHFHELPDGLRILGIFGVGQTAIVFTTSGIFTVRGLTNTNPADANGNPQHRVDKINSDLVLFGPAGVATWQDALVAPCIDGIYLIDGVSGPRPLSHPIERLYRSYVESGYRPGQAVVFRSHYLLPILSADGSTVQDLLVCRLDRPTRSRGQTIFPWTRFIGAGATVAAYAIRAGDPVPDPLLLAATSSSAARVVDASAYFAPDVAVKNDADGTTPQLTIVTRDYPTGAGSEGTARRVRWRYELLDAASDNPTLRLDYSDGSKSLATALWDAVLWDNFLWAAEDDTAWIAVQGSAPEDGGLNPFTWHVNKRLRYIRFRLQSSGPSAKLNIRALELFHRLPATRRT